MSKRISSCIVAYKPDIKNVQAIIDRLQKLNIYTIAADNTPLPNQNSQLLNPDKFLAFGRNMGIGYAYNQCVKVANENESDFIIFFDQDTQLLENFNPYVVLEEYEKLPIKDKVAIISLNIQNSLIDSSIPNSKFYMIKATVGNGMMIKTQIASKIRFREDLFLYAVDTEYCMRVRKHRYLLLAYADILLNHSPGEKVMPYSRTIFKILRKILSKVSHRQYLVKHIHYSNDLRYYMILRNMIYLISRGELREVGFGATIWLLYLIAFPISDTFGFSKTLKITLRALYHGLRGDLEKDNQRIISLL